MSGCYSSGDTKEDSKRNIIGAIGFYIEGLKEEGMEVPEPSSFGAELFRL